MLPDANASVEVDLEGFGNSANVMLRFGTLETFFFADGRVCDIEDLSRFVVVALECSREVAEIGEIGEEGSSTDVPVSSFNIG